MLVEEVDPQFWSGERNRRVAVPRRASLAEGRVIEEADEVTLSQDGDAFDRFELDVAGLGRRFAKPDNKVAHRHAPKM
jgi:hypothetical protein